jgi:protein SCO1/2
MQKITRRQLAGAVVGALAVGRPREARATTRQFESGLRPFPNVVLRTHENRTVQFYDDLLKGKTVLLTFMYATCEGICPGTTANLRKVRERFGERAGRDVFLYSITIKPKQDTPHMLKQYAEMHGAGPGWIFLTGEPADIELLRRTFGFVDVDPVAAADATSHLGVIVYGNEPLNRWAAAPALGNPEQIHRSVLWMEGEMPGVTGNRRHVERQTTSGGFE